MSENVQTKLPEFGEAVLRLQEFLAREKLSEKLLWIFRKDVTSCKRRVVIKVPIPKENQRLAEARYEEGRNRDWGISLQVLCALGNSPCCYIWLPKNEMEAEYALMIDHGLKMSVPVDLIQARAVKNGLLWRAYLWVDKNSGWEGLSEDLPWKKV